MSVLVDTSVLSLAFRRARPDRLAATDWAVVDHLRQLSADDAVVLVGAIRQEALSGIKTPDQFDRLRAVLDGYRYLPTEVADHDAAAEAYNRCRSHGIDGGAIDMLICATSRRHALPVFTVDPDFARYATVLPITLHEVPP